MSLLAVATALADDTDDPHQKGEYQHIGKVTVLFLWGGYTQALSQIRYMSVRVWCGGKGAASPSAPCPLAPGGEASGGGGRG